MCDYYYEYVYDYYESYACDLRIKKAPVAVWEPETAPSAAGMRDIHSYNSFHQHHCELSTHTTKAKMV